MIGITVKTKSETKKVIKKAKDANIKSLSHAGGALRKIAMRSFQKKAGASPPGSPPHTHTKRLPKAILYAVDKRRQLVIVGPAVHLAGQVGRAHEFGGHYMGAIILDDLSCDLRLRKSVISCRGFGWHQFDKEN